MLENLNPQQLEAVKSTGTTAIIAGPGSGKTHTLISKVMYMVTEKGIPEDSILMLSFTRKAAKELRDRIKNEVNKDVYCSTIHAFVRKEILKPYHLAFGYKTKYIDIVPDAVLYTMICKKAHEIFGIVLELAPGYNKKNKTELKKTLLEWFNSNVGDVAMNTILNSTKKFSDPAVKSADYSKYLKNKVKAEMKFYSYITHDLTLYWAKTMLEEHPEIAREIANKYRHIFVDEFQDTNQIIYDLIKLLTKSGENTKNPATKDSKSGGEDEKSGGRSLTVVGDADQAIYQFNRASSKFLTESIKNDYKNVKNVTLSVNYRSTGEIVAGGNRYINGESHAAGRQKKAMTACRERGCPMVKCNAMAVPKIVNKALQEGCHYKDIAVLFNYMHLRGTNTYDYYTATFEENNIPYRVTDSREKDGYEEFLYTFLSYIKGKSSKNPYKTSYPLRVLLQYRDTITSKNIEAILNNEGSETHLKFKEEISSYVDKILEDPDTTWGEIFKKITEIYIKICTYNKEKEQIKEAQTTLKELATYLKLNELYIGLKNVYEMAEDLADAFDKGFGKATNDEDEVSIMTVHKSKGLEFPVVIYVDNEKEYGDEWTSVKEQAVNCHYVAITRAKDKLYRVEKEKVI